MNIDTNTLIFIALAIMMILIEIIFSVLLSFENKRIVNDYVQ